MKEWIDFDDDDGDNYLVDKEDVTSMSSIRGANMIWFNTEDGYLQATLSKETYERIKKELKE